MPVSARTRPASVVTASCPEREAIVLEQLGERGLAIERDRSVVVDDRGKVVIAGRIVDHLGDDVVEGDESDRAAELVDHERGVDPFVLEAGEQDVGRGACRPRSGAGERAW